MKIALVVVSVLVVGLLVGLQEKRGGVEAVKPSDVKWEKMKGGPEGAQTVSVVREKKGPNVDLVKFPAGTRIPLHYHTANHVVTVLSGALTIGESGAPLEGQGKTVEQGGFFKIDGKTPHWTMAVQEAVICVNGDEENDFRPVEKQDGAKAGQVKAFRPADVKWEKVEGMPEGVQVASLTEDPKKQPFVKLLKFPANTALLSHSHTANRIVHVVKGTFVVGTGRAEPGKGMAVEQGGYFKIRSRTEHWTMAKEETLVLISGDGPDDIHWVEKKGD